MYDHASNLTSITVDGLVQSYSFTSTNSITAANYDANGSPIVLSDNTYNWDGENRIVRFVDSSNRTTSRFIYDGLGRLVRVVDVEGGTVKADHSYFWCGTKRCLVHDNTKTGSPVSTQYYDQGAIVNGTPYYYVKDRLGSVDELVTSSGGIAAQYTYDPYGKRTIVSGALVSDIGYAGYFYHAVSGLDFALFRAYDPSHGRWLNRDPIGEVGGINLYTYVSDSPASLSDPSGLWQVTLGFGSFIGAEITFGYNSGQFNFGGYWGIGYGATATLDVNDSGCAAVGQEFGDKISFSAGGASVDADILWGGEQTINIQAPFNASGTSSGGLSLTRSGSDSSFKPKYVPLSVSNDQLLEKTLEHLKVSKAARNDGVFVFAGIGGKQTFPSKQCNCPAKGPETVPPSVPYSQLQGVYFPPDPVMQ
jgi:RHS repeat-associated protein